MSESKYDWRSALEEVVDEKRRDLGSHPEIDEIVAYHAGELETEAAQRLQDHLVLCPRCAGLLLELNAFATDAATVPGAEAPARVVPIAPRRARRRRRWIASAAAVAASAIFLLWPRGGPLPEYAVHLEGGVSPTRAATVVEQAIPVVVTGEPLTLKLQPATAVAGPVTARAYLRRGAELRPLSAATLAVDTAGMVTLTGTVGIDLQLPEGDREVVLAVARPGALPSRQRLQRALDTAADEAARGGRWIGLERSIRVAPKGHRRDFSGAAAGATDSDLPSDDGPWIEYAGCRTIEIGPICVLPEDRRLTLWIGHPRPEDVRIEGGGWWPSHPRTPVPGGLRYEIEIGRWTRELVVEVQRQEQRSIWTLELSHAPTPDWLTKARGLYASGAWDEARRLLEPRALGPDPAAAGPALSLLARIERRSGRSELGDEHYRQAIDAHRRTGRLFDQFRDASGFAYHLIEEKRFVEARELLDALPVGATGGAAEARSIVAYLHGLVAEETGDLRAAMAWMTRAAAEAERAGNHRRWIFATDILARQLSTVGRLEDASGLYARIQPRIASSCSGEDAEPMLNACQCALLDVSRAWTGLLALEAGHAVRDPDPAELLAGAERSFMAQEARGATCAAQEDLPNLRLNRALAALHAGDPTAARRHLERAAVDVEGFPRLALWQLDVEARILLAEAQPSPALELYDDLGRQAGLYGSPEAAWRAAFGRAIALEALGRTGDALDACAEAEDRLASESLLVPMHGGRTRFIAQREQASRFCLDLLLREHRGDEALALIWRSAARALRGLRAGASVAALRQADRDRWQRVVEVADRAQREIEELAARIWQGLPRDEEQRLEGEIEDRRERLRKLFDPLAAAAGSQASTRPLLTPPAGVVLLAYHPLPFGWAALAAGEGGVITRRVEPAGEMPLAARSDEELAALLLEPFAGKIRRATEVQVVAYGAARGVDFHALAFDGDILLRRAPVVYRLGLAASLAEASDPSEALVVAGPGLLEAPAEARAIRRALESRPGAWRVELLEDQAAARHHVRQRLSEVTLFHYAGHADFDEATRGWDSHLMLAGGGRLTVDDILTLRRAPRWVVLSGCQTGRDARTTPVPGIGLAQAFLVAGTEAAVAATAEVSDVEAAALVERLYQHWNASTPLAVALQKAQLERRDQSPASDWRRFRILSRH